MIAEEEAQILAVEEVAAVRKTFLGFKVPAFKFFKDDYDFIQDLEGCLQRSLLITSPLKDILKGTQNRKKRFFQVLLACVWILYVIPRYTLCCIFYAMEAEKRKIYQYYAVDYFEELGLFGRTLTACYLVFAISAVTDMMILRGNQKNKTLYFLTDLLKITDKDSKVGLDEGEKEALVNRSRKKLAITKMLSIQTGLAIFLYEYIALPIFLWRKRPSILVCCFAGFQFLAVQFCIYYSVSVLFYLYFTYVLVTDFLVARIDNLNARVFGMTGEVGDCEVIGLLNDIDDLKKTLESYRRTLRPLLRDMVYLFRAGLSFTFFLATLDTHPFIKCLVMMSAGGISTCVLLTANHISQLVSKLLVLHDHLYGLAVRVCLEKQRRMSVKTLISLRLIIKELGAYDPNGNFVIGLSDGSGPAITKMEILNLTLETISNTFMFMDMTSSA